MRLPSCLAVFLLAGPLLAQQPEVRTDPARLVNGAAFTVRVKSPERWTSLSGIFGGRTLFFDEVTPGDWVALAGVAIDAVEGEHELLLRAELPQGVERKHAVQLRIERIARPTTEVKVPARFVEPGPKERARIKREQELKAKVFASSTPERLFGGGFHQPVDSELTDVFGAERVFNGARQSIHLGLDYRARTGTPITAANAGRVILARPLYYEGTCVAIDHGRGLITLYLHLSRLDVKEGSLVTRDQRLGLSGASGRVSGPHLHLAVRWQGVYLDPGSLFALDLR